MAIIQVVSGMLSLLRFSSQRVHLGETRKFGSWGNYLNSNGLKLIANKSLAPFKPVTCEGRRGVAHLSRLFTYDTGVKRRKFSILGDLVVPAVVYLSSGCCTSMSHAATAYTVAQNGAPNRPDYRVFIVGAHHPVSPFHDIPLYADAEKKYYNMVVEIPRWTNAKMEISKDDDLNPIRQDTKNGKLRYVDNVFPYHGYIWNYGAFPQTWEDPSLVDEHTGQKGDNDPIDVCEIGEKVHSIGSVVQVKVLGIFALIDEGETDWKVIVIDVTDPMASHLNDINDVEKKMPGLLQATNNWLRGYKIPKGKPENVFAFNGEPRDKIFAERIIHQTNKQWKDLIKEKEHKGIKLVNTTVKNSAQLVTVKAAQAIISRGPAEAKAAPIPADVDKWHYVRLSKGKGCDGLKTKQVKEL